MFENIFLCVNENNISSKYNCHRFKSFLEADQYYNKNYKGTLLRSYMIPVCKFNPFYKFKLWYKLSPGVNIKE